MANTCTCLKLYFREMAKFIDEIHIKDLFFYHAEGFVSVHPVLGFTQLPQFSPVYQGLVAKLFVGLLRPWS